MDDWEGVSQEAKEVIDQLLKVEPSRRLSAKELLEHPWLQRSAPHQQLEATALKHLKALETGTKNGTSLMELRNSGNHMFFLSCLFFTREDRSIWK